MRNPGSGKARIPKIQDIIKPKRKKETRSKGQVAFLGFANEVAQMQLALLCTLLLLVTGGEAEGSHFSALGSWKAAKDWSTLGGFL